MFETINQFLIDTMGELGPLIAMGGIGIVLILAVVPAMLSQKEDPLAKLNREQNAKAAGKSQQLRYSNKSDKLEKYSDFLEPQDEEEYSAVRLKLLQAGYPSKQAVRTYHFSQFALGIGLLVVGVLISLYQQTTGDPTTKATVLTIMVPALIGYMAPKYWVNRRVQERQEEITNGFPDSLDMMLVCVEAGQSLDQSIIRVSEEIRAGFPALADEFATVSHEMKAGKDKTQVLRDMSERAGVQDVSSFVTVLIQSQTFGTSIADALRVYAGEMRDKRVMRAEEKANTLPTKMTLATMMLTVPPLLIILIGPSVYDIVTLLGGGLKTNF